MTEARETSTEAVRRWRAANPERTREAAAQANRRARDGSRRKWAEIARRAAAEASTEGDDR